MFIQTEWLEESHYIEHRKYSIEYTFSNVNISNIFLDLIRVFNRQKGQPDSPIGLMTSKDEVNGFVRYLQRLCRQLSGILIAEPKLIKLNSPAIVVGDIQGNLTDLIVAEKSCFRTFPVMPENLIFLGNYSGENLYSTECLIYLFALKCIAPNKVFLLRGNAETRMSSGQSLKSECFNKFGRQKGEQVFEIFQDIFTKLPIAVVLDESILCVHSGIPQSNTKIDKLAQLPAQIFDVQKESPMAFDVSLVFISKLIM